MAPHTSPPGTPLSREEISCTLDNWGNYLRQVLSFKRRQWTRGRDERKNKLMTELINYNYYYYYNNSQEYESLESEPRSGNRETKGDHTVLVRDT